MSGSGADVPADPNDASAEPGAELGALLASWDAELGPPTKADRAWARSALGLDPES